MRNEPADDAHFQFWVEDDQHLHAMIARLKDKEEFLTLGSSFDIDKEMQEALSKISVEQRDRIYEDIRLAMLGMGVSYNGIGHPLKIVTLELALPCGDELNEYEVFRSYTISR